MPVRPVRQGVWDIDFVFRHPDGTRERVRERFKGPKKVAHEEEHRLFRALLDGTYRANNKEAPLLKDFAEMFLETYSRTNNKPSEYQSKRSIITAHINPTLGELRIDQITPQQIEEYKGQKVAAGLEPKTVNNHLTVLRTMLTEAVEWGLLTATPRVKWLKTGEPDFDFLTFGEAIDLVDAADAGLWRTMIYTGIRTGMRHGELLGLRRDAVSFDAGTIRVARSIVCGELVLPKSKRSIREIPMSPNLQKTLAQWLETHQSDWVFCGQDSDHLLRGACKWPLYRACAKANIRRIGWHVLRHTFASHLAMRGVSLVTIRDLMGHTSIKMTERYANLTPDHRASAVALLDTGDCEGVE